MSAGEYSSLSKLQADLRLLLEHTISNVELSKSTNRLSGLEDDVWSAGQRLRDFAFGKHLPSVEGSEWLAITAEQCTAMKAQADAARVGRSRIEQPVFIIRYVADGSRGPGWYARLNDTGHGHLLISEHLEYLVPSGKAAQRFR